jgi:hypothetical protein
VDQIARQTAVLFEKRYWIVVTADELTHQLKQRALTQLMNALRETAQPQTR